MTEYSQENLINDLTRIFPEFHSYWRVENDEAVFPSSTLHSVYTSFLPFLGNIQPTEKQWKQLADHLNNAVASGGDQENAADTCFLEHLHQVELNKKIRPTVK